MLPKFKRNIKNIDECSVEAQFDTSEVITSQNDLLKLINKFNNYQKYIKDSEGICKHIKKNISYNTDMKNINGLNLEPAKIPLKNLFIETLKYNNKLDYIKDIAKIKSHENFIKMIHEMNKNMKYSKKTNVIDTTIENDLIINEQYIKSSYDKKNKIPIPFIKH